MKRLNRSTLNSRKMKTILSVPKEVYRQLRFPVIPISIISLSFQKVNILILLVYRLYFHFEKPVV